MVSKNVNSQSATSRAGLCGGGRETRGNTVRERQAGKVEREHGEGKAEEEEAVYATAQHSFLMEVIMFNAALH